MLGPSAFYRFTHVVGAGYEQRRFAVAYKPPGPVFPGAIEQLVLDVCKGPLMPDALVVLTLAEEEGKAFSIELNKDSAQIARQRLHGRIPLLHAQYSLGSGDLQVAEVDGASDGRKRRGAERQIPRVHTLVQSGLVELFKRDHVLLTAPPGYEYQKPSGARARFFIKPDLALSSSAAIAFVSLAVFIKLFAGRLDRARDLSTVFVDTMAISTVAYGLRELLELCGHKSPFLIESFHSYGGFDAVRRPLDGTSVCLISASTSMSLHQRWVTEKEAPPDEVLTLLTLRPHKKFPSGALLAIEPPPGVASIGPPQLSIHIRGETFLPEQELPKRVLLSDKVHRSDVDVENFHAFAGEGVFDVYRRPLRPMSSVRSVFVDGEKLIAAPKFMRWLEDELPQRAKAATRLIVYQDDSPSRELAIKVQAFCERALNMKRSSVVSAQELVGSGIQDSDAVIVCAAVVGKGSQLLEISRALRDKHSGARLYLVGYQVAETLGQLKNLPDNLRHSKGVPHDYAVFGKAAIGGQLAESFRAEISRYGAPVTSKSGVAAIDVRSALLGGTATIGRQALLPHGARMNGRLELRPGFAYWPDGYEAQPYQPEVLATVGVLLQRAREAADVPEDRRLSTGSFRQVMLHPENFARFNDGVVQAALLRNAYPSELDYRSDEASSEFMKSLILRCLARANEQAGEGALEFLLAISLERLQLMPAHRDAVLAAALEAVGASPELKRSIRFILKPSTGRTRSAKPDLPF